MAISKDRHARIIIMRREITLYSEAGYIFADCSRRNRFFLLLGGGPYMLRQLHDHLTATEIRFARTPVSGQQPS